MICRKSDIRTIVFTTMQWFTFGLAISFMPFIMLFGVFGEFETSGFIAATCAALTLVSIGCDFLQGD